MDQNPQQNDQTDIPTGEQATRQQAPGNAGQDGQGDQPSANQAPSADQAAPGQDSPPGGEQTFPQGGQGDPQDVIMQDPGEEMTSTGEPIVENEYETDEAFEEALEGALKTINESDIVEGVVVKIDPDEALLDIGYKSEGVIPARELSIKQDVHPQEVVQVGDVIEALVMTKEDAEGRLVLSKKRAQYERAWGTIDRIFNEDKTVRGTVIEVVKGGLILDIGLRGFLPASLVEMRRVRDLNPYVGTELECKIIELDKNRNNVVLSRRKFLEETQSEFRQEFLSSLEVGEIRQGQVSSIVNFGAFVDLGGVDGLVHVSELAWQHIDHPSEIVDVGDEIEIEVLDVDLERERVSLSLKATQEDPWTTFDRENDVGDIIPGQVTKLVPFGAFVAVAEGIEGLVHISELADRHVEAPESVVNVGETIDVKIIDIDTVRRRISLSLKQVGGPSTARQPESQDELTPEQIALAETAYVSGEEKTEKADVGGSSALGDQLRQAGFATTEETEAAEAARTAEAEEAPAEEAPADDESATAEPEAESEAADETETRDETAEAPDEAGTSEEGVTAEEAEEMDTAEAEAEASEDAEVADEEDPGGQAATADAAAEDDAGAEDAEAAPDEGEPALEGELAGQAEAADTEEAAPAQGDVEGADLDDVEGEVPDTADEEFVPDETSVAPAKGIAQADEETVTEAAPAGPAPEDTEEAGPAPEDTEEAPSA